MAARCSIRRWRRQARIAAVPQPPRRHVRGRARRRRDRAPRYGMGACAADYDNDGHVDLYLTNFGANALYRNNGDGTFTDVTAGRRRRRLGPEHELRVRRRRQRRRLDLFVAELRRSGSEQQGLRRQPGARLLPPGRLQRPPERPVPQQRRRHLHRRHASRRRLQNRRQGPRRGVRRLRRRWPRRSLRRQRSGAELPVSQRGRGTFREVGLSAGVAVASDGKAQGRHGHRFRRLRRRRTPRPGRHELRDGNAQPVPESRRRPVRRRHAVERHGRRHAPFLGFGAVFLDYDNDGDLDLAIANGHVLDNTSHFQLGVQLRAAQAASSQRRAGPLHRCRRQAPGPASRSRRSAGRSPQGTSTTTAISICS